MGTGSIAQAAFTLIYLIKKQNWHSYLSRTLIDLAIPKNWEIIVIGMPYKHTEIIPTLWGNTKCDYTYILSLFGNVSNVCNHKVGL